MLPLVSIVVAASMAVTGSSGQPYTSYYYYSTTHPYYRTTSPYYTTGTHPYYTMTFSVPPRPRPYVDYSNDTYNSVEYIKQCQVVINRSSVPSQYIMPIVRTAVNILYQLETIYWSTTAGYAVSRTYTRYWSSPLSARQVPPLSRIFKPFLPIRPPPRPPPPPPPPPLAFHLDPDPVPEPPEYSLGPNYHPIPAKPGALPNKTPPKKHRKKVSNIKPRYVYVYVI